VKISNFFDNLNVFFENSDELFTDIKGSIYRDSSGDIYEIRFFNEKYDEFIVVDRKGNISCINITEEEMQKLLK